MVKSNTSPSELQINGVLRVEPPESLPHGWGERRVQFRPLREKYHRPMQLNFFDRRSHSYERVIPS